MAKSKSKLPGCIYLKHNRWYWKVKLLGEDKAKAIPLRPTGSQLATKDRAVAEEVARELWCKAIFHSGKKVEVNNTIAGLVNAYLEYEKNRYNHKPASTRTKAVRAMTSVNYNFPSTTVIFTVFS